MPEVVEGRTEAMTRFEEPTGHRMLKTRGPDGDLAAVSGRVLEPASPAASPRFGTVWRFPGLSLKFLSFAVVVLLPTMVSGLYLGLVASRQYVAEFKVAVRSVDPIQTSAFSAFLGLGSVSQSGQSSYAVVQYLRSRKAIEDLGKAVNLGALYRDGSVDWLSRLRDGNGIEEFVRYWQKMMDAFYETSTSTITVRVHAFKPADALAVSEASLKLSEALVNQMSERTRNDTVRVAEAAVEVSRQKLETLREEGRHLRDIDQILDPRKAAESNTMLINKIREQLLQASSDLAVARRTLHEDSPSVVGFKSRIVALQDQLGELNGQNTQTGQTKGFAISSVISDFQKLESETAFAEKSYQSELSALQQARLEAARQQVYLVTIVPPGMPEEADYPRPFSGILTVFAVGMAVWIVGMVGLSAVREHM